MTTSSMIFSPTDFFSSLTERTESTEFAVAALAIIFASEELRVETIFPKSMV